MGFLQTYIAPTLFTLLLHVIVIAAVLVGWQMSDSQRYRVDPPRYIEAKLVTLDQPKARKTLVARKPPPKPVPSKQPPKPIERQVLPRQAPVRQTFSTEKRKTPPPKTRTEPKPPPKPVVGPTISSSSQTQTQQQYSELDAALAEEESLMAAEEDEMTAATYAALIKQRVQSHWSRPPSARKNMQVVLSIRLIPTGDVVGVEVVEGSGNAAFDRSAIVAVERAERFLELSQMPGHVFEGYFRTFTLVFKPEDLLL